jgi:hypothetical protein
MVDSASRILPSPAESQTNKAAHTYHTRNELNVTVPKGQHARGPDPIRPSRGQREFWTALQHRQYPCAWEPTEKCSAAGTKQTAAAQDSSVRSERARKAAYKPYTSRKTVAPGPTLGKKSGGSSSTGGTILMESNASFIVLPAEVARFQVSRPTCTTKRAAVCGGSAAVG